MQLDEDTTEYAEEGAGEEGRARGAGSELRGVHDYGASGGTQAGERMDAKFGTKFGAGRSFSDRTSFSASLGVPLARLPPPPARGYSVRRPGEEVDERVPFDFLLW